MTPWAFGNFLMRDATDLFCIEHPHSGFGLTRQNKTLADYDNTSRKAVLIFGSREKSQPESSMSHKRVIAVVDDDAGIRRALAGLLTSWGHGVELYESAEEFIRAAISS